MQHLSVAHPLTGQQLQTVLVDLLNARMARSQDYISADEFADAVRRRLADLRAPGRSATTELHSSAARAMVRAATRVHMEEAIEQLLGLVNDRAPAETLARRIDDFIELATRIETATLTDPRRLLDGLAEEGEHELALRVLNKQEAQS